MRAHKKDPSTNNQLVFAPSIEAMSISLSSQVELEEPLTSD